MEAIMDDGVVPVILCWAGGRLSRRSAIEMG